MTETTRVGTYLIVELKDGAGQSRKFVTNAVPMSEQEFQAILVKTKLPGYYRPSGSTYDNTLGSIWQKTFGYIADPKAQGLAENVKKLK